MLTVITSVKKFPVGGGRDDGGGGIELAWSTDSDSDIVKSNHPRDLDSLADSLCQLKTRTVEEVVQITNSLRAYSLTMAIFGRRTLLEPVR